VAAPRPYAVEGGIDNTAIWNGHANAQVSSEGIIFATCTNLLGFHICWTLQHRQLPIHALLCAREVRSALECMCMHFRVLGNFNDRRYFQAAKNRKNRDTQPMTGKNLHSAPYATNTRSPAPPRRQPVTAPYSTDDSLVTPAARHSAVMGPIASHPSNAAAGVATEHISKRAPFGRDDQLDIQPLDAAARSYRPADSCPFGRDDAHQGPETPPTATVYPYAGYVFLA
jgi:hypothetical protein